MSDSKRKRTVSSRRHRWHIFMQDVRYNIRNSSFRSRVTAFGKLFILLFILIGIPVIMLITMRNSLLSAEYWSSLPERLEGHRILSFFILIILQMAQIVISVLPGQPIQMAGSYLYGVLGGYLISIIGATLGCIITYYLASFLGSDALHVVFGEEKVRDYVSKLNSSRAYVIIFLIYAIPAIPKDLVSYVAGISDIRLRPFVILSTLGRTPCLIGSLLIGKFLREQNYVAITITGLVILVIFYICWKNKDALMERLSSEDTPDTPE